MMRGFKQMFSEFDQASWITKSFQFGQFWENILCMLVYVALNKGSVDRLYSVCLFSPCQLLSDICTSIPVMFVLFDL